MINTEISWCNHTANLWIGCQRVHAGCDNCYAEAMDNRWSAKQGTHWGPHAPRKVVKSVFDNLAKFQKEAAAAGRIDSVFVGSMMDIFEKPMPLVDHFGNPAIDASDGSPVMTDYLRDKFFEEVVPASPNLLLLLLTKRPGNIPKYIPTEWLTNPPKNVMYGTSPVNQETADDMIPKLLQVPGRHFLSCEPLLGPIDLTRTMVQIVHEDNEGRGVEMIKGLDWVIAGGESGHGARPMHPDWVRSLRDQCDEFEVPFHFKQWGHFSPYEADAQASFFRNQIDTELYDGHQMNFIGRDGEPGKFQMHKWYDTFSGHLINVENGNKDCCYLPVGKGKSGRLLDGKEHNDFPNTI